jgi:hypothetical protein
MIDRLNPQPAAVPRVRGRSQARPASRRRRSPDGYVKPVACPKWQPRNVGRRVEAHGGGAAAGSGSLDTPKLRPGASERWRGSWHAKRRLLPKRRPFSCSKRLDHCALSPLEQARVVAVMTRSPKFVRKDRERRTDGDLYRRAAVAADPARLGRSGHARGDDREALAGSHAASSIRRDLRARWSRRGASSLTPSLSMTISQGDGIRPQKDARDSSRFATEVERLHAGLEPLRR